MSKKIVIGKKSEGFDLNVLLTTRLLVQANSGGGKSYALRRLSEQLAGKVQTIIIDPEGEFSSLREKHEFLLIGKEGETPADTRSAALLALRLLELNVSAICDIYELQARDRHRWVRLFLEALINAPKKLWHPVVIIVDEAHIFAPEKGHGESEASQAMIDLATRGRKRGFCPVIATQRLGKLSKNVSAELQNVLIGATFQDIDRKRAAETLGVAKSDERKFYNDLKLLDPGTFFCFGRAISNEILQMRIAPVSTTHPQSGMQKSSPPATPAKIKHLLPKLSDLPKEAEQQFLTEKELRKRIVDLEAKLKNGVSSDEVRKLKEENASYKATIQKLSIQGTKARDLIVKVSEVLNMDSKLTVKVSEPPAVHQVKQSPQRISDQVKSVKQIRTDFDKLPFGEEKVLTLIIQVEKAYRDQITVMTGYKRSSRDAYLQRLSEKGLIEKTGDAITATAAGIQLLGSVQPLPTGQELQAHWLHSLPEGESKILQILINSHPGEVNRIDLDDLTGYKRSSRDAYLQRLSQRRLVTISNGKVRASDNLF